MSKTDRLMDKFGANIAQTVAPRTGSSLPPVGLPPDKYEGGVKLRSFAEMPVDSIECGPQPRTEFDQVDLEQLAKSIKRFGQLAPIRVRHDAEQGKWVVLVGERRLRACRLAGLKTVRVEFVEREMTEADILAEQVVENAARADLKPVEQGRAYERLMALNGWNAEQVAETLGIEPTGVHRSLGIARRLAPDVAALVDAGKIKATAAYEISKLQIADDQRHLAERVVAEGLDHKATAAEVARQRKVKTKAKTKRKAASRQPQVTERPYTGANGVVIVIRTKSSHTARQIAEDVREIADELEMYDEDSDAA